jgi:hypothetical protein
MKVDHGRVRWWVTLCSVFLRVRVSFDEIWEVSLAENRVQIKKYATCWIIILLRQF